jgi:hypothetical protein
MAMATVVNRHWTKNGDASGCHRCGGLMVTEWCSELDSVAWRCVQCGELLDAVILQNRKRGLAGVIPELTLSGSERKN